MRGRFFAYHWAIITVVLFLIAAKLDAEEIQRTLARAWVTHCVAAADIRETIADDLLVEVEADARLGCSFVDSYIGGVKAEGYMRIVRNDVAGPIEEILFDAIVFDGRRLWAIADWAESAGWIVNGARYEFESRLAFLEDGRPLKYQMEFMRNASRLTLVEEFDSGDELVAVNPDTTTMVRVERTVGAESIVFLLDYRE